jgi:lycopene cyclase-like protein
MITSYKKGVKMDRGLRVAAPCRACVCAALRYIKPMDPKTISVDVLMIGAGPAGLALAAALAETGLRVGGLSPSPPETPWPNTYGIWLDELDAPGLRRDWLGLSWQDTSVYTAAGEIPLDRAYGLFDNGKLQDALYQQGQAGGVFWLSDRAAGIQHSVSHSQVTTGAGEKISARLVIDASGHKPVFVQRPLADTISYQAAYGVIGRFTRPPVRPGQLVLMDYRADHLSETERREPPTFLYAMDFGEGVYFVEETSLAYAPPIGFEALERRLWQRLAAQGVELVEQQHVEHCLFPMDLPLPNLEQPVFGYGGAASMVHPASGYQVGEALRRAPEMAQVIAAALARSNCGPLEAASAAWHALWSPERVRRRNLYLFGLANMLRFDEQQIQAFFATFFSLPQAQWGDYLSNRLDTAALLQTMWRLFRDAPNQVRWPLAASVGHSATLLWDALRGY